MKDDFPSLRDLIRQRYSCRTYEPRPIAPDAQTAVQAFLDTLGPGPLGTPGRFRLIAATDHDHAALKGLGTYGFIRNAPGFLVGAVPEGPHALEDFGYLMERAILHATGLGLGTCWLGGTFSKSRFAQTIGLQPHELLPAVTAIGHGQEGSRRHDLVRWSAGASHRRPPDMLFFDGAFDHPLSLDAAGPFADVLDAVRWAPSASNRQPWRLLRLGEDWHFFLERSRGYGKGSLIFTMLRLADLQRVDMGIAMCHFELVARELDMTGHWGVRAPANAPGGRAYIATWSPSQRHP